MFKIITLVQKAVANIHNINEKIQIAYSIWQQVYALFAKNAAAGVQTTAVDEVKHVIDEAEAAAEAAITNAIKL